MNAAYRIAADIGGTFTDVAFIGADGTIAVRKVPSTPASYADGVIRGVRELAHELTLSLAEIGEVLHGCTVATNAILEHKGAKTALLTTKGFRDVLELQRISVPRLYEPLYVKPEPLVPRRLRFEIDERSAADGQVLQPLDRSDVMAAVDKIRASGVEAVAVCFLHAYANPGHELEVGDILRRELPDVFLSLSAEVLPQLREYERTSTTVINSYVGPPVKAYLENLRDQLRGAGIGGRLLVMQSSGGILDAETAMRMPAQIVECGPAAGVIGAAHVGAIYGYRNLITLDMGGTTAKAALVENGELLRAEEYEVGAGLSTGSSLAGGGGYALKLPVIDISEVGAGGGSIVWLDKAGAIKVGPQSAGAVPGPACYGTGGQDPTVTDANMVLGYLNPSALAGGSVPVQAEYASAAIERRIAGPLGRSVLETAYGIHGVANANMMRAVKAVTTYRGRDPRDFALFAFGGNGGVHGVDLARALQINTVIVPPAAGVFSALGLLFAAKELNLSRAFLQRLGDFPLARAQQLFAELEEEIAAHLGEPGTRIRFAYYADMRYSGQAFELTIAFPESTLGEGALALLGERFEDEHEKRYGHKFAGHYPLETVNLRVIGTVITEGASALRPVINGVLSRQNTENITVTPPVATRRAYFGPELGTLETPVLDRAALTRQPRRGPLIVEEYDGTAVVPPDCTARLDEAGHIIIELD